MPNLFTDRGEAGRLLASCLTEYANRKESALVVGIPRGGVLVAVELAHALHLDVAQLSGARLQIADRTVILVDEVIVTPDRMRHAIAEMRDAGARRVVAAAPVLAREVLTQLWQVANDVAFLLAPQPLGDPSQWYQRFPPVSEADLQAALSAKHSRRRPAAARGELVQFGSD